MAQPQSTPSAPSAELGPPVRQAISKLDELVTLVTSMLALFCGDAPADVSGTAKLQAFGQQYQTKTAQLRVAIQRVAEAAAAQSPQEAAAAAAADAAAADAEPTQPAAPVEGAAAELAAELERLKQAAVHKNGVLFQLITQLRDMLDSVVMWETFSKTLAQETGKKHDRA